MCVVGFSIAEVLQLTWNIAGWQKEILLELQINRTQCVTPAYPNIKHLCGHYLPLSSFASNVPSEL